MMTAYFIFLRGHRKASDSEQVKLCLLFFVKYKIYLPVKVSVSEILAIFMGLSMRELRDAAKAKK